VITTELIADLQKGDPKAQKAVYDCYSAKMLGVCLRYLKNEMDAEEVMITGMVKVFQNAGSYEGKGNFEGWVRRIVVNEALMFLRKKEPLHLAVEKEHFQLAAQETADTALNEAELLALLHELPAGYRAVFNLYAVEGYSHKEIADMLQITEGTSKSQLSKARNLLQKWVTTQENLSIEKNGTAQYRFAL
jgi:RNA polymerase sigma factor (sigma-70 family)